jgi:hypothetical protein
LLHEDALRLPDHHLICVFRLLLRHGDSLSDTPVRPPRVS